ncbi:4'-phosphopantetheinyl transferase [Massilia sp. ST3]|uniref:4'-phosphopantetheinyl transferase family protein n=1 Tax=Massilia sp. ST3 TaxID=2824903 RepID=UPI001B842170|nr:4'-phosphopantetheinyl transferase superfamily protein [Massilia sp. ST3]MBQ5946748.1 4'-phosphopantetheinyl transferase superfamily protein [Massilia sp. ST3]
MVEYAPQRFDPSAFAAAGLHLPVHIARSVPKRQAEYFFGRLAARLALEPHGLGAEMVKTGMQREPVWPPGVIGSITHAAPWCAAVVPATRRRGLGIDIEMPLPPDARASVIATALARQELEALAAGAPSIDQETLVALAFSAKESFYKGLHGAVRRFFGFEAMRILAIDPERGHIDFAVAEDLCPEYGSGAKGRAHLRLLADGAVLTAFAR